MDALLGDDRRDVPSGRDVEGGMGRAVTPSGAIRLPGDVRHLVRRALLDRDVGAARASDRSIVEVGAAT